MGIAIEKIELRIILLCKKNNINFKVQKSEYETTYSLDNYKLGIITIKIQLSERKKLDKVYLYGINDALVQVADRIGQDESLFGLPIDKYILSREDYQNTILIATFDNSSIDIFENLNASSDSIKSQSNIFTDKIPYLPRKIAYNRNSTKSNIVLSSNKFNRPEHFYLNFDENSLPDENGNANCFFCVDCKNCENCIGCIGCTGCDHCTNCKNCNTCIYCFDSINCSECTSCLDCNGCTVCLGCDSMIARSHLGTYCANSDGIENGIQKKHILFPDIGSVLYHDKIESFFLINHFEPYHRPYENANNYNWHIQWRISRDRRSYWITEEPTKNYFSFTEISMFIFMNKLQYEKWELEAYIKESFNIPNDGSIISNVHPFIEKMLIPKQNGSQTIYDEIKTKNPSDCNYNSLLYDIYNKR